MEEVQTTQWPNEKEQKDKTKEIQTCYKLVSKYIYNYNFGCVVLRTSISIEISTTFLNVYV